MESAIDTLIRIGQDVIEDEAYAHSVCQAQPAVYGIIAAHQLPAPDGYEDGHTVVSHDYTETLSDDPEAALLACMFGEDPFDDVSEAEVAERRENTLFAIGDYDTIASELTRDEATSIVGCLSAQEIAEVFEELEVAHVIAYQRVAMLERGPFALTHKGIQRHIELNGHNLPQGAHSYAMTAYRVPEMDDLKRALATLATDAATPVGICPVCKHEAPFDMELLESDDDPNVHKRCTCHACHTTWVETYAHVETRIEDEEA